MSESIFKTFYRDLHEIEDLNCNIVSLSIGNLSDEIQGLLFMISYLCFIFCHACPQALHGYDLFYAKNNFL